MSSFDHKFTFVKHVMLLQKKKKYPTKLWGQWWSPVRKCAREIQFSEYSGD